MGGFSRDCHRQWAYIMGNSGIYWIHPLFFPVTCCIYRCFNVLLLKRVIVPYLESPSSHRNGVLPHGLNTCTYLYYFAENLKSLGIGEYENMRSSWDLWNMWWYMYIIYIYIYIYAASWQYKQLDNMYPLDPSSHDYECAMKAMAYW